MPHQSHLDAPDTLHPVMVRGLETRAIFRDDADRAEVVARVAALAAAGALTVYARAVLPTHTHLLVRTGTRPLPRSMRSPQASRARAGIAYLWLTVLGHLGRPLAPVLGVQPQNVSRAAAAWERLPATC